jgi:hypothetical protein
MLDSGPVRGRADAVGCRANACFHLDQARRQVGKPRLHLAARPLLPQHNGAALILANDVKRVLANIDADFGQSAVGTAFAERHALLAWQVCARNGSCPSD